MPETPSKRRRKGREAFEPGVDPMDVQPFNPAGWGYESYLEDFLDGWKEALDNYRAEQKAKEEDPSDAVMALLEEYYGNSREYDHKEEIMEFIVSHADELVHILLK